MGGTPSRSNSNYWGGNIPWINSGEVNNLRIMKESEYITELGLSKSSTILNLQERINQANAVLIKAGRGTSKRDEDGIPLWQRYSLSVPEAAKYFGIGETRLYQIVAEHPGADFILEIGSHVKIKRVLFERFLDAASCV